MKSTCLFILLFLIPTLLSAQTDTEHLFQICNSSSSHPLDNLQDSRININARDEHGNTPLMIAASKNNFYSIKSLVEAGAEINAINQNGQTALTILRISPANDHPTQKSIWNTYAFLKNKGAFEQDYVTYITKNISGNHSSQQKEVLKIKQNFRDFNGNIKSFSTKKHTKKEGDYKVDGDPFSSDSYIAKYDAANQLVFFEHQYFHNAEWEDNGMHWKETEQYYFKDGALYFYFFNGLKGSGAKYGVEKEFYQYRFYITQGKKVIAAEKTFEDFYNIAPEEVNAVNKLINCKFNEQQNQMNVDSIQATFNTTYKAIKDLLK